MPHSHNERMAQLQNELAVLDAAIENGHPGVTREELERGRSKTLRRIAEHTRRMPQPETGFDGEDGG